MNRQIAVVVFAALIICATARPATAVVPNIVSAAINGDAAGIDQALAAGQGVNSGDSNGETPLHWATIKGNLALVEHLTIKQGCNPNLQDKNGFTPLMWASQLGHKEIVATLLASGADATIRDKRGYTAAQIASAQHHDDIAGILEMVTKVRKPPSSAIADSLRSSNPEANTRRGFALQRLSSLTLRFKGQILDSGKLVTMSRADVGIGMCLKSAYASINDDRTLLKFRLNILMIHYMDVAEGRTNFYNYISESEDILNELGLSINDVPPQIKAQAKQNAEKIIRQSRSRY